jgi:hypothetical protein
MVTPRFDMFNLLWFSLPQVRTEGDRHDDIDELRDRRERQQKTCDTQ